MTATERYAYDLFHEGLVSLAIFDFPLALPKKTIRATADCYITPWHCLEMKALLENRHLPQ